MFHCTSTLRLVEVEPARVDMDIHGFCTVPNAPSQHKTSFRVSGLSLRMFTEYRIG